jgi:hypothetical protein
VAANSEAEKNADEESLTTDREGCARDRAPFFNFFVIFEISPDL